MKKKLILVAAPPASGKTYVADKLARALRSVVYLDKDALEALVMCAFDLAGEARDMDGAFYREHIRPAEYRTIFRLSDEALRYADLVLVNAPFGLEMRDSSLLRQKREELNRAGIDLVAIWVCTDPEQCRARMQARGATRDAGKLADWERYAAGINYTPPMNLETDGAVDRLILFDNNSEKAFANSLRTTVELLTGS